MAIWLAIYFSIQKKPTLQKQMLWSSLILAPVGLIDHWFIPEYWHPKVLFSISNMNIEALLFCFAVGGIGAVFYELVFHWSIRKTEKKPRIIHWGLPIIMLFFAFSSNFFLELNVMYDALIGMLAGTIYLLAVRFDLRKQVLVGGLVFTVLYILVFGLLMRIDSSFVNQWSLENLSGKVILDIPIEEIYWAFLFGAIWAVVFEDFRDYKTVNLPSPELEKVPEKNLA